MALPFAAVWRAGSLSLLLIALISVQVCPSERPTAPARPVRCNVITEPPRADAFIQRADSSTITERARILIDEMKAAAYPELRGVTVHVKLFHSQSDYFRARFAVWPFLTGRRMRYIVFANPEVFTRQAPEASLRAILAHELAHVLYFSQKDRLRLLGLVRLTTKGFTAHFERWADLQALARGYGEGLKAYRQWLYRNIPAKSLDEKRRDYFSPEEIDAMTAATQRRPELWGYWLKHVPLNLEEIVVENNQTPKR
jgi:hypothetical protein